MVRPAGLPSAPINLVVDTVYRDAVSLRWERPASTGGVPLSGYIIEQLDGKSSRWRTSAYTDASTTWWTIPNLIQGFDYTFRVRAENPDGAGQPCTLAASVSPQPVISE